ncbi:MAG TPA: hypothetical protein VE954_18635 [Oligoflexus sp.]|uniref:hypothetical protein n=1 Tax=Oligoflexus sp. TaxID=1971216 RepID=UPI002D28ABE5|nr:hypothetical protein [Oligoflexus sp.]HYX35118.1 hypothetical protein [Oligoflexus sp.]
MRKKLLTSSVLAGILLSSSLHAKPVFEEATENFGVDFAKPYLRLLPNSEVPSNFFLIPKKFVGTIRVSDLFGGTVTGNLIRQNLGPNHAIFRFLVSPDISLQKALTVASKLVKYQNEHPEFYVSGLECPAADLNFNSIPRALYSAVKVQPIAEKFNQYIDSPFDLTLPEGYFYTVEMETTKADTLQNLLLTNGAKGAAILNCDGYVSRSDIGKPSTLVGSSIAIDAKFYEVVELEGDL